MIMTETIIDTEFSRVWSGNPADREPAMCPHCLVLAQPGRSKECRGHVCAAWRWASDSVPRDLHDPYLSRAGLLRGYCGLAGVPHDLSL